MSDEKTEKPTPKRLKEARKEGQVARTQELGAWSALLLASLAVPTLVGWELTALQELLAHSLRTLEDPTIPHAMRLLAEGGKHVFVAVMALSVGMLLVSVAGTIAQGGFYVATKAAKPSAKNLNLLSGAKRVFGPHALWEGIKMLVKCSIVAVMVYGSVRSMMPLLGGMVPFGTVFEAAGDHAVSLLRSVAVAGVVMAAVDYAVMRRRTGKQTRMSKHDIKQEHKQSEGDPLIKSAIRGRQLAAARNRMMADVPQSDVVLVNPTHVAVALRYQPDKNAPIVVARGAGAIAAKIRETATGAGVPLVQDVPLARALYSSTEVGQQIPAELFAAVAQVLAFVIGRRNSGRPGGRHDSPRRVEVPQVAPAGHRKRRTPTPAISSAPALSGR
ncbi:EscU/YscU/HrcU family type III secretion system export apparatus switch protein [Nocardioides lianchengensis]|uniref:Flagellar biosynthetic protein FlhB n=1 Tax=Nocardioides lianchengensis TaxID=1045774 RepID=A0A1G6U071_9ACTN|nr:EscU/YscU/HrcU family type III secretion system export apparatus switch protein [Nocardioides lianchengensis]NYG11576.1 flagellar biosynthetic protein FlhB [Nocardioides lianchengensis]SDD34723.1 flagellar biosynthetic protein FlhB [Nocardioides lianchengensis]